MIPDLLPRYRERSAAISTRGEIAAARWASQ
jgi:hypothetical protein